MKEKIEQEAMRLWDESELSKGVRHEIKRIAVKMVNDAHNAALSEAIEKVTNQIEKSQDSETDDAGYKALQYFKDEILGILEGLKIKP